MADEEETPQEEPVPDPDPDPNPVPIEDSDYDARKDLGPPRPEDQILTTEEGFEPAELSSPEVPLEESRKDETTVLATDTVRVNSETGELEIIPF